MNTAGRARRIIFCFLSCTLSGALIPGCAPPEDVSIHPAWDRKVILLAMDGLDWEVLDPLIESGEAPAFARLKAEGAWARLHSPEPLFSPILWTSIATGKTPAAHGIRSFTVETAAGPVPVTSNLRRAPALWQILSRRERSVGVIGWWATWPAEEVNGFLCTDRTWPITMGDQGWPLTSEGRDALAGMKRRTYPEGLMEEIRPFLRFREDFTEDEMGIIDVRGGLGTVGGEGPSVADVFAKDLSYDRMGRHLHASRRPDFFSVYFDVTDVMAHYFWPHYTHCRSSVHGDDTHVVPPPGGLPGDVAAAIGRNFEKSYIYMDSVLRHYLDIATPQTYIIVVSDHGYGSFPDGPEIRVGDDLVQRVLHWHDSEGVLLVWGRGVEAGVIEASIYDVAPTVLWLMGLPVAEDMEGSPLLDAFKRPLIKVTGSSRIATYEMEASGDSVPVVSPEDPAYLERLRSLGYIR